MSNDLITEDLPPMSRLAMEYAARASALAKEIALQEKKKADLTQLVLSEINDFFAGISQPGAPEAAEEMQAALMARVESVMRDHQ
ncbi:hypothetical protein [Pectobacterium zantedeschiae]|uniref:Uncharacterized protein n=1 Tax=Pectobacterium zantedeschiae TaxID=2034769 RepID=A0A9X8JE75_9GAMM|nr:hypothetical protein [Pectobacterium zantedeschiae]RYC38907.1 hypothetical protein CLR69_21895 [Pectobacterium zantedeschiae]